MRFIAEGALLRTLSEHGNQATAHYVCRMWGLSPHAYMRVINIARLRPDLFVRSYQGKSADDAPNGNPGGGQRQLLSIRPPAPTGLLP